jgi:hypothetical protein
MKAIGFRAEKTVLWFAVIDSDKPKELLADGKVAIQGGGLAESFVLLRTEVLNLLKTYKPNRGAIRLSDRPKGAANVLSMLCRARVEGVAIEAAGAHGLDLVTGASPTIKSGLKTKTAIRDYAAQDDLRGIDLSKKKNPNFREAVVAALSILGV